MTEGDGRGWVPFRPDAEDLKKLGADVAEIGEIQKKLLASLAGLRCLDRVAHQYQIAGSKVVLNVAASLPEALEGVGLFMPRTEHKGIGRISTGLGTPHIETNPDFLGAMLAFQTAAGRRVDFLGLNDPSAPTDDHRQFMDVLQGTAESAGAHVPLIGEWGEYDVANLVAAQAVLGKALAVRMGVVQGGKTLFHLTKQTIRTVHSSTAYQPYWTGIVEVGATAGKFTLVPARDENHRPGFRPGERHLSEEWKKRQRDGDVDFGLYWIPFLDEDKTPLRELTRPWEEAHKVPVGTVRFPKTDPDSEEARLWAILATEMGANPGNWIHDKEDSIKEPATEFGAARKIAYQRSQEGRGALEPRWYQSVFETARIGPELAHELRRRREEKEKAGHTHA